MLPVHRVSVLLKICVDESTCWTTALYLQLASHTRRYVCADAAVKVMHAPICISSIEICTSILFACAFCFPGKLLGARANTHQNVCCFTRMFTNYCFCQENRAALGLQGAFSARLSATTRLRKCLWLTDVLELASCIVLMCRTVQVSFVGATEEQARETAQKKGYGDKVAVVKTSFKANTKVCMCALQSPHAGSSHYRLPLDPSVLLSQQDCCRCIYSNACPACFTGQPVLSLCVGLLEVLLEVADCCCVSMAIVAWVCAGSS